MSWTHLEDTRPKARKRHCCDLCGYAIPVGMVHVARRGIGDDGPCTVRMHEICEELSREWDEWGWENQDVGEFRRELLAECRKRGISSDALLGAPEHGGLVAV